MRQSLWTTVLCICLLFLIVPSQPPAAAVGYAKSPSRCSVRISHKYTQSSVAFEFTPSAGGFPSARGSTIPSKIRLILRNSLLTQIATRISSEFDQVLNNLLEPLNVFCAIQSHVRFGVYISHTASLCRPYTHDFVRLMLLMFLSWFRHLALVFLVDTKLWPVRLIKTLFNSLHRHLYRRHDYKALNDKLN